MTSKREVVAFIRQLSKHKMPFTEDTLCKILGTSTAYPDECYKALADLIEQVNLGDLAIRCFERMEGCNEPEFTLFSNIYDSVVLYGSAGGQIKNI